MSLPACWVSGILERPLFGVGSPALIHYSALVLVLVLSDTAHSLTRQSKSIACQQSLDRRFATSWNSC